MDKHLQQSSVFLRKEGCVLSLKLFQRLFAQLRKSLPTEKALAGVLPEEEIQNYANDRKVAQ